MHSRSQRNIEYIIYVVLFLGVLSVLLNVNPYGDDLFYGRIGRLPFNEFLARQAEHYQLANGRALVHFLLMPMLSTKTTIFAWRIINALFMTLIAFFSYRISRFKANSGMLYAFLSACVVALLGTGMTRQSVYWLTGSFNYVFPLFCFLLFWFLLERAETHHVPARVLPVFAFITGATVEQIGMMCFGLCFLSLVRRKIKKNSVPKYLWLSLCFSFIGMLTLYLAPAFLYRVNIQESPVDGGIFALIKYNIVNQYASFLFSSSMIPFQLMALVTGTFYNIKGYYTGLHKRLSGLAALGSFMTMAAWILYIFRYREITGIPLLMIAAVSIALGYSMTLLWSAVQKIRKDDGYVPLFALILGFGSQIMMLVSPTYGGRTQLCALIMLAIYTISTIESEDMPLILSIFGLLLPVLMGEPALFIFSVAALTVMTVTHKNTVGLKALACVSLALISALTLWRTQRGYAANMPAHRRNMQVIEAAIETNESEIVLEKYPLELYGWAMPYHNPYYDPYYKQYYGLSDKVQIIWEDAQE